ncbi:aspartic protease [Gymnopilus junonius]|uniref:Aspartic protease n=1 Tax=Gymnopilus junonius TaxID=109634 RepID=A0A9P5NR26_GYMJU|nr:aspartic protease [Gymnopilus junonius]
MFPKTLLTTLLLALSVAANPVLVDRAPVSVSFSRRVNATSVQHLVRHDQARAKYLKQKGAAKAAGLEDAVINFPVENQAVSYIASIGVGSPATTYNLIVDTGSSNTWVGAGTEYVETSTSTQTSNSVYVSYGSGSFSGIEYTDTVTIGSSLTITEQSIGVASSSTGFDSVDGILGIGPLDLTEGTLSPDYSSTIPTVTDNLFFQGIISAHSIGISFEPSQTGADLNGEITWGGVYSSKYTGSITYIPVTSTSPANEYWGINQSIKYGTSTTILSSTAGIVDTGTTLILIATNGFNKYKSATGATLDNNTGLLAISSANFNKLSSLFFTTGGTTFELTANAQIWPRALNNDIGGTASKIYLITSDLGSNSGEGLDFINGQSFLERFYSVFDTANNRVGLATTPFTKATSN